jgi:hypothetical protein
VLSSGTGQENDTGTALTAPPYLPVLPRQSCHSWKGVDAHFLLAGDQASAAQLSVTVGHGKNTSLGSVNLAGYYPGWAARQFALITSFAEHRCGAFATRDEITGARIEMRPAVTAVHGLGDQALLIKIIQVNGPAAGRDLLSRRLPGRGPDGRLPGRRGRPRSPAGRRDRPSAAS